MINKYLKDNFIFFKEPIADGSILGDRLLVESAKIDSTIKYINSKGIKSVTIDPEYYELDDLAFLQYTPDVTGVYLLSDNIDVSWINNLKGLRVLTCDVIKQGNIDLKNFPYLEILGYSVNKKITGIGFCTRLSWLWIEGYKNDNLLELKSLVNLKYLNLHQSSIKNLEGIEDMRNLQKIRLDTMRNLESLKGLNKNLSRLEVVDIWAAKNLTNYDELSKLKNLKQLELGRTGECQSISFIKELSNLKKVALGFKVLDGNMSYLEGIEKVGFIDFPYYTHKMKDFNKG
jgi:hypothetical protein